MKVAIVIITVLMLTCCAKGGVNEEKGLCSYMGTCKDDCAFKGTCGSEQMIKDPEPLLGGSTDLLR